MSNEGLRKEHVGCLCFGWERVEPIDLNGFSDHHSRCPMHHNNLVRDALKAMRVWAQDCDGVHYQAWDAYQRLYLAEFGELPNDGEEGDIIQ